MDKKKFVFQLDTPFSTVKWPQITLGDQDTLLELLCNLLSPLGEYRTEQIRPSKGKREKKRKRKGAISKEEPGTSVPPAPLISSFVDVGLTAITRRLQTAAQKGSSTAAGTEPEDSAAQNETATVQYAVIFVARSGQPSILNTHLPQMIASASEAHPSKEPIRLVGLSKACEDRLSESIGIPRVSCIGLREGAPSSNAIIEFARQHVSAIDVPWLKQAAIAEYLQTNINTIQTTVGSKKQPNQLGTKPINP